MGVRAKNDIRSECPANRPDSRKQRILLVDDHPIIRDHLKQIISETLDLTVCGEAEDRGTALAAVAVTKPDLLITDLNLKNSHGLDLIKDIRPLQPKALVLVLSRHDEKIYAERCLRAGAHGYISKQESTSDILIAIRSVLNGGTYVSDGLARAILATLVKGSQTSGRNGMASLADRELQVFDLIGQGHGPSQIAHDLGTSVSTIETYCARVKEKLNLANAAELRQTAIQFASSSRIA